MKKITVALCALMLFSTPGSAQSYKNTEKGVSAQVKSMDIEIQFYGPSIVRVVKSPEGKNVKKESLSVVKTPEKVTFKTRQRGDELLLKNKRVEVALNLQSGKVTFKNTKGQLLLTEKEAGANFTDFDDAGVKAHSVKQSYLLDPDETIYRYSSKWEDVSSQPGSTDGPKQHMGFCDFFPVSERLWPFLGQLFTHHLYRQPR